MRQYSPLTARYIPSKSYCAKLLVWPVEEKPDIALHLQVQLMLLLRNEGQSGTTHRVIPWTRDSEVIHLVKSKRNML